MYCATYGDVIQAYRPTNIDDLLAHELAASGIADGMTVLDAGCGVGGPALWFARRKDIFVEAITISGVQAEWAKAAVASAGLSQKIHVQQGDYHQIDRLFPAAHFDRVLFLESLCHAEDYKRVLAGARHVLKPGGQIYIKDYVVPDFREDPEKQRALEEGLGAVAQEYNAAFPQRADFLRVLDELAFDLQSVQSTPLEEDPTDWYAFEDALGFQWRKIASVRLMVNIEIVASRPHA